MDPSNLTTHFSGRAARAANSGVSLQIALIRVLPWLLIALPCVAMSARPRASKQDIAVLSVIIQHECTAAASHHQLRYEVVPNASASIVGADELMRAPPKRLSASAIRSLVRRNKVSLSLQGLPECSAVKIVSAAPLTPFPGWKQFYKLYPRAWSKDTLSLPGYSADGDVAIVQEINSAGPMAGLGWFVVLRKVQRKWVIQRYVNDLVS